MLIWDIIRDWFVMNIWGGLSSSRTLYTARLGALYCVIDGEIDDIAHDTSDYLLYVGKGPHLTGGMSEGYISLADWLSTTSTIIVLVAVSVGLYFLTRYFFRMFAGLLSGR